MTPVPEPRRSTRAYTDRSDRREPNISSPGGAR